MRRKPIRCLLGGMYKNAQANPNLAETVAEDGLLRLKGRIAVSNGFEFQAGQKKEPFIEQLIWRLHEELVHGRARNTRMALNGWWWPNLCEDVGKFVE